MYTLTNSMEYTNPDMAYVAINGLRVRTPASAEYIADGTSAYLLPQRLGFSQALISDNEVRVYINDVSQTLGVNFTVEPYDGITPREVLFTVPPSDGDVSAN